MTAALVVTVAYATDHLDFSWVPRDSIVVVVHNDDRLVAAVGHPDIRHVQPGLNVGFGAAINLALAEADADRLVLANPDIELDDVHGKVLVDADPDEVVVIPLDLEDGSATSVVNPYWGPITFAAAVLRVGRLLDRDGWVRKTLTRVGTGGEHRFDDPDGAVPARVADVWASGAVVSYPLMPVREVGGFDEAFFMYFEDADMCQRLSANFADLAVRVADVPAGLHRVGGTITTQAEKRRVAAIRRDSAAVYAQRQSGWSWAPWRGCARFWLRARRTSR